MKDGAMESWEEKHRNFVLGFFHGYTEGFIDAVDFVEACADDHVGYTLLFEDSVKVIWFCHRWEDFKFCVDWIDDEQYEELKEARIFLGGDVCLQ